jgi:hypothetical protein
LEVFGEASIDELENMSEGEGFRFDVGVLYRDILTIACRMLSLQWLEAGVSVHEPIGV